MLIIGAGGFAKELLQILHDKNELEGLGFYDDLNKGLFQVFDRFPVLKNDNEVFKHFERFGNEFIVGIGNPHLRYRMVKKFEELGGSLSSCISSFARIGKYQVNIGKGVNILDHAIVSNNVQIGIGCILYYNSVITHDCEIGNFIEISPSANVLGHCRIDSFTSIGANATILPNIIIGKNVIVAAGAVVTRDVSDNCVMAGVPAIIKRKIPEIGHDF